MHDNYIHIKTGKDIVAKELTRLRGAVSWADREYFCAEVERSIETYPFTARARNLSGELVGYVSAFSDGVFMILVGELLVHPDYQRRGIGAALLKRVELRYPGIPVNAHASVEHLPFFKRQGYITAGQSTQLVSKNNTPINESVIAWAAR